MKAEHSEPQQVALRLDWSAADGVDVKLLNQMVVQLGSPAAGQPDGFYLLLGEVTPPVVVGDDDETRERDLARYEGMLPVNVHGRYFVSRARMDEFIELLQRMTTQYDEISGGGRA